MAEAAPLEKGAASGAIEAPLGGAAADRGLVLRPGLAGASGGDICRRESGAVVL